jgi:hypothetical protein
VKQVFLTDTAAAVRLPDREKNHVVLTESGNTSSQKKANSPDRNSSRQYFLKERSSLPDRLRQYFRTERSKFS